MLFEVKEGIWFDNLSATIHRGTPGARRGPQSGWEPEPRRGKGWHPTLVYLSSTQSPSNCQYCHADCGSPSFQTVKPNFTFEDYMDSYEHLRKVFGGFDTVSFFGNPLSGFAELRQFVEALHARLPRAELPDFAIHIDPSAVKRSQMDFLERYNFRIATQIAPSEQWEGEDMSCTWSNAADRNDYNRVLQGIDRFTDRDIHVFAQYTFDRAQLDRYEPGLAAEWYSRLENLQIDNYDVIPIGSSISRSRFKAEEETQRQEATERYLAFCEESADYYLSKLLEDDISKLPRMFVGLLLRIMTRTLYQDCSAGYSLSITPDRKIFPCHAFASDERFAVSLDDLKREEDLLANVWFRGIREADRLHSAKCEKCIALRACSVWCKAQTFGEQNGFDRSLDERCMLMAVYTRRIVQFLVEQYPKQREFIRTKLLAYDRDRLRQKSAYETI